VLSCNALFSRLSSEKSFITILAAIGSQEKKRENGALQEVLPVRRSHIRTMTLRAWSCSRHKTDFNPICARAKKKCRKNGNCLGSQPSRTDPYQRLRAIARRTSLTPQPAKCQLSSSGRIPRTITLLSAIPKHIVYAVHT
jgi:hypothetical protein